MWWLFEQLSHENGIFRYAYSTESKLLDGIIEHNTKNGETRLLQPSTIDQNREKAQGRAVSKFNWVVRENFPARKMVACG